LLVTGAPRSGTTWLARQLAGARGCAMTGREPMNPNPGQYRLGATLDAWARLKTPNARQLVALRLAYAGLTPRVYGRYGHRQWAAPWPGTRTVVKDPFAVLSIGAVVRATSALPVLVYRHPAAVLASYRRMGWLPDVAEVSAAVSDEVGVAPAPVDVPVSDPRAMAWFWSTLYSVALRDLADVEDAVVVSHEELAVGGTPALGRLFEACGLAAPPDEPSRGPEAAPAPVASKEDEGKVLHRLDRPPDEAATAWRSVVDDSELAMLDDLAGPTFGALQAARLPLG
jgi:hypothetical protein